MAKEIERKFLVSKKPHNIDNYVNIGIIQWYLSKLGDSLTNRLRLYSGGSCIFEIKKGNNSISKEEVGFEVNFDDFHELIKDVPCLEKQRYTIEDNDKYYITLDEYKGNLSGLYILEVEGKGFNAYENVINYKIPKEWDWVDKEVSDDRKYSNHSLAIKQKIY